MWDISTQRTRYNLIRFRSFFHVTLTKHYGECKQKEFLLSVLQQCFNIISLPGDFFLPLNTDKSETNTCQCFCLSKLPFKEYRASRVRFQCKSYHTKRGHFLQSLVPLTKRLQTQFFWFCLFPIYSVLFKQKLCFVTANKEETRRYIKQWQI
jgi:hypothetical protein